MFFKKKSFAELAVKSVTKQLKKEKKDIVSKYADPEYYLKPQLDRDRLYNLGQFDQDSYDYSSHFDDECFKYNTVPEVINAISESIKSNFVADYRKKLKEGTGSLWVAENVFDYVLHESSPFNKTEEPTDNEIFLRDSNGRKTLEALQKSLEEYYKTPGKKFCDVVKEYENKKKITGPEVYKPVLMSKQTYSKVVNNITKQPDFKTCVQFAFALKLTFPEAKELFRLAGNAFSDDIYHRVVKLFIEKHNYNIDELNAALYKLKIPTIGAVE